jgi:hypothetical protein
MHRVFRRASLTPVTRAMGGKKHKPPPLSRSRLLDDLLRSGVGPTPCAFGATLNMRLSAPVSATSLLDFRVRPRPVAPRPNRQSQIVGGVC